MNKSRPKTLPKKPRKRGGQPRNRNALRHGFYANHLPQDIPWSPPPNADFDTLEPEIRLLQVNIHRVLQRLDSIPYDHPDAGAAEKIILAASHRLDNLHRFHALLQDHPSETRTWLVNELACRQARSQHPNNLLNAVELERLRRAIFPEVLPIQHFCPNPGMVDVFNALVRMNEQEQARVSSEEEDE